jgi:hypothetical protein
MLPRFRSIFILVPIVALIAGTALVVYGRWSKPLVDAADAIGAREPERALGAYAVSAARFRRLPSAQQLFARDFALLTHNRLALLYQRGEYDALIEAADAAPADAAAHFWVGCALFARSRQAQTRESQLEWLGRAEDEFKLALTDAPDDWDTKYNYEVVARLAAALRNQPKAGRQMQSAPTSLMQLLRPQPTQRQQRPVKKAG